MFIGEYNHNLDSKGRIIIPTKYEEIQKTPCEDVILVKKHKYSGLYDLKKMKNAAKKNDSNKDGE